MKHEFNVKKYKDATIYTLESASGGATGAGAVASVSSSIGGVRKRGANLIAQEEKKEAPKPRNFVAKNAKMGGAGQHKDKKKAQKQGNEKHKKPYMEALQTKIATLKSKLDEISDMGLNNYRRGAHYSIQGHTFGSKKDDPNAADVIAKREKGMQQASNKIVARKKAVDDERVAALVAKLPELKAEYEQMSAEYKSLGGSNWQYADREQNLTDRERKARSMEGPMNNLWRQIQAAEKSQGVAEGVQDTLSLQDAAKVLKQYGATNLKTTSNELHFYKDGRPFSVDLIWNGDLRDVNLHELNHVVRTLKAQDNKFNFNPDDNWSQDFEKRMSKGVAEGLTKLPSGDYQNSHTGVRTSKPPQKKKRGEKTGAEWDALEKAKQNKEQGVAEGGFEENYMTQLARQVAEKLDPNAPVDTWIKDFQQANPEKYHQFRQNNQPGTKKPAEKIAQMATAASYAAKQPNKK